MIEREVLSKIENIEQNLKIIDNIFKCIPLYWQGESAMGIQELYSQLQGEIDKSVEYMERVKSKLDNCKIKKLRGDIF